jgi:hypothetical protein
MSTSSNQLDLSDAPGGDDWSPIFGDDFLPRLVGAIMKEPEFAVVELVSNCVTLQGVCACGSKEGMGWPNRAARQA